MKNAEKLLEKAHWDGPLTKEEIAYVAQGIKDTKPGDDNDLAVLISTLGFAGALKYRTLVEKFLYYPTDPWISRAALQTLCKNWCLTKDYLNELKMFIRGVEWDDCDDVRLLAISLAGEFLRNDYDKELLHLLIAVFEDLGKNDNLYESRDHARALIQGVAYEALARAMGKDWGETPDNEEVENYIREKQFDRLDLSVVQQAHARLEGNQK